MANFDMPRAGSAAANALATLYNMGGKGRVSAWLELAGWKQSQLLFCRNVVDRLERCWLIRVEGDVCDVTRAGRDHLGIAPDEPAPVPPVPVGPRYVAPMRPLNVARVRPPRVMRPGSMDFQTIPSRIANQSVAYKGPGGFAGVVAAPAQGSAVR